MTDASTEIPPTRILIVDDEATIREVVGRLLEREGVTAVKAESASEGLRRFQQEKFDLVITDRMMPGLNGEQFAQALKGESPDTPIILITGQFHGLVNATHFDGFLAKPFTRLQLIDAIDDLLPVWRDTMRD